MDAGTRDFATPEEAEASPLAEALFDLGDVTGVFFGRDFVSVTAAPGVEWRELKPDVLGILLDHFIGATCRCSARVSAGISVPGRGCDFGDDPADAEIVAQIKELIETRVRPAVANDGGDIVYRGFDKGKVYLQMQGACAGCPSSSATLKQGIEQLLKPLCPRSHRSARRLMRGRRLRPTSALDTIFRTARSDNGYTRQAGDRGRASARSTTW